MSTRGNWHKTKSTHNKNASDYLNLKDPTFHDWEITSIFYSALHLVDAYLLKTTSKRPSDHYDRNQKVKSKLPMIKHEYRRLYFLSRTARYDRDVTKIERDYALRNYIVIKQYLDPKI